MSERGIIRLPGGQSFVAEGEVWRTAQAIVARTPERTLASAERTLAAVQRTRAAGKLDEAIDSRQIERGERPRWERLFERDYDLAVEFLGDRPADPERAARNEHVYDEAEDKAERVQIAREYGIPVEDVV